MLVETQEWAEDREFIQQKLAAIEQRKLSSGPEEEMAASIEYITLALGVELRQNQVKKYQDLPDAASQPDPPSSPPLIKSEKLTRQRSSPRALHEKRPDNYFSLRIGKERKKDIEKVTSIYHKTDHRRLKNNKTSPTVLPHYQSDKYSLSDDSSSSDEEGMPLSYITTTRGPLDRRMKPNLQPKRVVPMSTIHQVKPANVEPTFQFKATDDALMPVGQRLGEKEENRISTSSVDVDENRVNDISLNPDNHIHMDDISSNPLSRTEDKSSKSHDSNVHETGSNASPLVSNARTIACNLTPRVSPSLSVFAKNRNPIRSGSPSQRAANRLSTHNYPSSGVHMSPTPEFPTQAQRKKPLPKIPEIKSSTVVTSNIDLNEETL
ncbi:hypothetical protein K7432_009897 [Basidiobolus ranarum]|uniref:Uncharacterized protein n=1 Tax=Basidiobolus ranarum TaxID=34480 RepID=A0ABR2VWD2_9FUNG